MRSDVKLCCGDCPMCQSAFAEARGEGRRGSGHGRCRCIDRCSAAALTCSDLPLAMETACRVGQEPVAQMAAQIRAPSGRIQAHVRATRRRQTSGSAERDPPASWTLPMLLDVAAHEVGEPRDEAVGLLAPRSLQGNARGQVEGRRRRQRQGDLEDDEVLRGREELAVCVSQRAQRLLEGLLRYVGGLCIRRAERGVRENHPKWFESFGKKTVSF